MFPFRPSRAAVALLELAEAMLAPEPYEQPTGEDPSATGEHGADGSQHPHRRGATIERRRRPGPSQPEQTCLAPLTRAGRRARETQRAA
ncbi:MAG TPA: hypothetical protein VFS37_07355 [Conexibacter sp.]|nr:hypothetical protein [Conexibacter sp.]